MSRRVYAEPWGGVYDNARGIPPGPLMTFAFMGDARERFEASEEILRRLYEYDESSGIAIDDDTKQFKKVLGNKSPVDKDCVCCT